MHYPTHEGFQFLRFARMPLAICFIMFINLKNGQLDWVVKRFSAATTTKKEGTCISRHVQLYIYIYINFIKFCKI